MISKKILIIAPVLIIAAIGAFFAFRGSGTPEYDTMTVSRGVLVQEVGVTGRVKPAERVDLAFEISGRVEAIHADTGDRVAAGDRLVSLESGDLMASLAESQALARSQQAKLDELLRGTRTEELRIAETKVSNAQNALRDAETSLANITTKANSDIANLYDSVAPVISSAHLKADDAVNKQIEALFTDDTTPAPKLTFIPGDSQSKNDSESLRALATTALARLKTLVGAPPADTAGKDAALIETKAKLKIVLDLLAALTNAVNTATGISDSTKNTYQGNINTGRTNVNTELTAVINQEQSIASQKITNQNAIDAARAALTTVQNALRAAQDELALKVAGATPETIASQRALVEQAQAGASQLAAKLAKAVLRAPFAGLVTERTARVGEIVAANAPVITMISSAQFEIEASIAETDVVKVSLGDNAEITLDAYGNDVIFHARVVKMDPAETLIEGVPTYKTTLAFTDSDERIKSGMTANVTIETERLDGVISVPLRAVEIDAAGKKFVRVLRANDSIEERAVTTGVRSSDGSIEITSGLSENERVITFFREP